MDIRELQTEQYQDIFGGMEQVIPGQKTPNKAFGLEEQSHVDIFAPKDSITETTTVAPTGEPNPGDDSTTDTTTVNADILGTDEPLPPVDDKKPAFKDISGYFEDRIKSGRFVPIEEEVDGKKTQFIPKTPEEFDEVIDIQLEHMLNERSKNIEAQILQSKSPAWQAVLKYSEMVDDPAEVLPFIQGVKTIETVKGLDENNLEHAEKIVRARLEQRGDTEDVISEQIESLKTTDKLISAAQKYKPLLLNQEQEQLARMVAEERQKEAHYYQLVTTIRENAIKAIESPLFGKQKLRMEEKAAVYELIAEPNPESKGYAIYDKIDKLYENGDLATLTQVALFLEHKDAFIKYISATAADKTAGDLQRKLRVSTDSRSTAGHDGTTSEQRTTVQRNSYTKGGFGRN